tara:strand:- start:69 stop:563 length:495 start_codon:yes stop_codon:yes gene_type:complete
MKNMKLIMENFKKNMAEMFKGRDLTDDELEKMDPVMRGFIEKSRKSRQDTEDSIEMEKQRIITDPETPEEQAIGGVMKRLENEYGPDLVRAMHEMPYEDQETAFEEYFSDAHPQDGYPKREDIEIIRKLLKISDPEEDYKQDDEMEASDMEDPPGYMPGQGGNY